MRNYFLFFFLFFIVFKGFSQFELPKKTLRIVPMTNSSGKIAPTSSRAITYPSIFDKKDKLLQGVSILKKQPEEGKSIFEKEHFESPAQEYTDKMNQQMKKEGISKEIVNSDFFFGEFKVTTFKLNVGCRDYGQIDGDMVAIWLNDKMVEPKIDLESGYKKYEIELKEGLNTIQIEALNTGSLFPNTGQFLFLDGNNKLVTNQMWNLNTGYKAIVKIRKVDMILEEGK